MKKFSSLVLALAIAMGAQAQTINIVVKNTSYQTVTGFGGACCDGAMCPLGSDTQPVRLTFGPTSKVGLNILRMEISPNFKGDINAADIGWDTQYDWYGSVPSARIVKQRGGIVFGTPWSPPGEYKTNGSAEGGNSDKQGNIRAELRKDCYEKFFPWLNTFLAYMKSKGVEMDAVSVQNEPDWWVNYSGCLYTPKQQLELVKNYAHMLDREKYPGIRLISAEPLGFDKAYSDALLNDPVARQQVDIIAGHIYGHAPLDFIKPAATPALRYGKEVWMTEHSVSDYLDNRLPSWDEQLEFARELNECMLAGCTGYIYWYLRAHWGFVGTGEAQYGAGNGKNKLLPRAYVMSHYAKNVTGSTRIAATATGYTTPKTGDTFQTSAYVKGDSIIVMVVNSQASEHNVKLYLPSEVKSGTYWLSTGNETENLCQETEIPIEAPTQIVTIKVPKKSLNTFIFTKDDATGIIEHNAQPSSSAITGYYDMQGRRIANPQGLYIEKHADGTTRKVFKED